MSVQIHTIYPAIIKKETPLELQKLRIAAYCRVSKATPELLHSLEIQMLHFNMIIAENPNWTLYKIYSDVASGTRKSGRSGYCQMLRDAKRHRFDYIFVKSLSRFGRDTLEALSTIRRLKSMNIGLLSEVEKVNTLKIDDATLSILFAVAQEESATKSENIKFGIHQRMREGKPLLNHTRFLGYTKDAEGQLVIVPEEAEIVRKIFSLYLEGNGVRKIKRYLEEHGIKTVTGKSEWSTSTIDRMLSNEKYMGTLLLQKTYTPDFLTGKQKKNRGELSMYVIEDAHEAIVEKDVFEAVQKRKLENAFAEIIALLVKELHVNVLLTTHSPNFMLALDAYMRKYSIADITNFYQTDFLEDGFVHYNCVNDDMGKIYQDFLQYLSEVKMLRKS